MSHHLIPTLLLLALSLLALPACMSAQAADEPAPVAVGDKNPCAGPSAELSKAAPDFELTDTEGNKVKLSDFAGKTVVLEWFNPGCPYVKYAHGKEGPMAALTKAQLEQGVVWLAINSGAPGKQGHGVEKNQKARADWGMDYPVLIDETGVVGRMYGAKTTPHMFVVDATGNLVYRGALDNAPFGDSKGKDKVEYVGACVDAVVGGTPVGTADTKSYGCSIKYGS